MSTAQPTFNFQYQQYRRYSDDVRRAPVSIVSYTRDTRAYAVLYRGMKSALMQPLESACLTGKASTAVDPVPNAVTCMSMTEPWLTALTVLGLGDTDESI